MCAFGQYLINEVGRIQVIPQIRCRAFGPALSNADRTAGFTHKTACTGAVTQVQRFGSALNLNIHFHMLFLDGVYTDHADGHLCFHRVAAPTGEELSRLEHTVAQRIGRHLERQGLLQRDVENDYLTEDAFEADALTPLHSASITYRIALGPQQGRKVFTLQTLPACADDLPSTIGTEAGFSLHAGVVACAHERDKVERLCRYVSLPPVAEPRSARQNLLEVYR